MLYAFNISVKMLILSEIPRILSREMLIYYGSSLLNGYPSNFSVKLRNKRLLKKVYSSDLSVIDERFNTQLERSIRSGKSAERRNLGRENRAKRGKAEEKKQGSDKQQQKENTEPDTMPAHIITIRTEGEKETIPFRLSIQMEKETEKEK